MITNRQKEILKFIIEEYVKTVKPVSSNIICQELNCSSATIRNEMVILEDLGYLEKNHFASGRQPSEKGYKYYVENLMRPKELNGEEMLKLQTIFHNQELQVSDAISKCMEITEGTIYPLMKRLKDGGLIDSYIVESNEGPPRKYYKLTEAGQEELSRLTDEWFEFAQSIERLLKGEFGNNDGE